MIMDNLYWSLCSAVLFLIFYYFRFQEITVWNLIFLEYIVSSSVTLVGIVRLYLKSVLNWLVSPLLWRLRKLGVSVSAPLVIALCYLPLSPRNIDWFSSCKIVILATFQKYKIKFSSLLLNILFVYCIPLLKRKESIK